MQTFDQKRLEQDRVWSLRAELQQSSSDWLRTLDRLQHETGLSRLTLRVCLLRGLNTAESIQAYLYPRFDNLTSPLKLQDMDRTLERLVRARAQREKIRIFGDYDVDGTAASALLMWVFREYGFQCFDVRQPDRFKDGYGLNVTAVQSAFDEGVRVLVTVDCGITSFEAIQKAKALGLDVLVLDHHQLDPERGLPEAYAVINPQRKDCRSGLQALCGCGLAFYLARALRSWGQQAGWFEQQKVPNLKQHLDLVVMATAADMVPLIGDNRILVRYGLQVLRESQKVGVRALMQAAGLGLKEISPSHLGFVLGPRINASGRMSSASLALELLTTQDESQAIEYAQHLERLNDERTQVQNAMWDEVKQKVEYGLEQGQFQHGVVVADQAWHEGVLGIVASRVTEMFRKPAIVIALGAEQGKGSVRSYAGKDVLSALRSCQEYLIGFGGHRYAAGLSLKTSHLPALIRAFDHALGQIPEQQESSVLWVEGECRLEDLTVQSLQELEHLAPFGPSNPEPIFTFQASVQSLKVLKERHWKLRLNSVHTAKGMDAIWFHAVEKKEIQANPQWVNEQREWAAVPELNRYRGQVIPTLRIKDWRAIHTVV